MRITFCGLCLLFLVACQQPKATPGKVLLNVDSLLQKQVSDLQGLRASKETTWGDSIFQTQIVAANWKKELAPFEILNLLNKPGYSDLYQVSIEPDTVSNLFIKRFTALGETPLKYVSIYFLPAQGKIKRIRAAFVEQDFYYEQERELTLDFAVLGIENKLERIEIQGRHRYLWVPDERFRITIRPTP